LEGEHVSWETFLLNSSHHRTTVLGKGNGCS
jgi:hypothetical protein